MDKRTVQQPKVQQFESTGFQDPQAAAETSGSYYYSYDGKLEGRKKEKGIGKRVGKMGVGSRKGGEKSRKKNSFLKLYTKFFGGKIFTATRVVSKNSQFGAQKTHLHNEKL